MKKSPCKSSYPLQSGRKISLGLHHFLAANSLLETKKEKERKLLKEYRPPTAILCTHQNVHRLHAVVNEDLLMKEACES